MLFLKFNNISFDIYLNEEKSIFICVLKHYAKVKCPSYKQYGKAVPTE